MTAPVRLIEYNGLSLIYKLTWLDLVFGFRFIRGPRLPFGYPYFSKPGVE
jgi:hypothetical protein